MVAAVGCHEGSTAVMGTLANAKKDVWLELKWATGKMTVVHGSYGSIADRTWPKPSVDTVFINLSFF